METCRSRNWILVLASMRMLCQEFGIHWDDKKAYFEHQFGVKSSSPSWFWFDFSLSLRRSLKTELPPSGRADSWARGGSVALVIDFCFCGKACGRSVFLCALDCCNRFSCPAWTKKIHNWTMKRQCCVSRRQNCVLITSTDTVLAFCLCIFQTLPGPSVFNLSVPSLKSTLTPPATA